MCVYSSGDIFQLLALSINRTTSFYNQGWGEGVSLIRAWVLVITTSCEPQYPFTGSFSTTLGPKRLLFKGYSLTSSSGSDLDEILGCDQGSFCTKMSLVKKK